MKTAILVLSRRGLELARVLAAALPGPATIFGPACVVGSCAGARGESRSQPEPDEKAGSFLFETEDPAVRGWLGPLRAALPAIWQEHQAIVAIMAAGIMVRLAGPLARDKRHDPAVVVVDEAGRFAISLLGGHGGGANKLTHQVASALEACPVITTSSDVHGLPAVDLIGREWGWKIERAENLNRVAAQVVNEKRIAVWQDAGSPDWWKTFGSWPQHFVKLEALEQWKGVDPAAVLVISDRAVPDDLPPERSLIYRPRTLVAGIGCKRGVSPESIAGWVDHVFQRNGLACASLAAVATVTLKALEFGLMEFAESRGVPLLVYTPEELDAQPGIATPSERVRAKIGIAAVAEPAALRGAGTNRLLVTKKIGPGITVAVARRSEQESGGPEL